jgi:hypothetical protein
MRAVRCNENLNILALQSSQKNALELWVPL